MAKRLIKSAVVLYVMDSAQGGMPVHSDAGDSDHPYQHIAADLRAAMRCGALDEGDPLPSGSGKDYSRSDVINLAPRHYSVRAISEICRPARARR